MWESRALALAYYSLPLLINICGIFALEVTTQEQILGTLVGSVGREAQFSFHQL